jgi:hypothetical protein
MIKITSNIIDNNFKEICIKELKEKTKYNILNNDEIKRITGILSFQIDIDILFETEQAIICINYSNIKSNVLEFNKFVNSVKEINKLNKSKKCYGIFLSISEPIPSCKNVFNKENANFEKTSNIKFITIYNNKEDLDNHLVCFNLLKRLQNKLHSLGIYYYDNHDDSIIMAIS